MTPLKEKYKKLIKAAQELNVDLDILLQKGSDKEISIYSNFYGHTIIECSALSATKNLPSNFAFMYLTYFSSKAQEPMPIKTLKELNRSRQAWLDRFNSYPLKVMRNISTYPSCGFERITIKNINDIRFTGAANVILLYSEITYKSLAVPESQPIKLTAQDLLICNDDFLKLKAVTVSSTINSIESDNADNSLNKDLPEKAKALLARGKSGRVKMWNVRAEEIEKITPELTLEKIAEIIAEEDNKFAKDLNLRKGGRSFKVLPKTICNNLKLKRRYHK